MKGFLITGSTCFSAAASGSEEVADSEELLEGGLRSIWSGKTKDVWMDISICYGLRGVTGFFKDSFYTSIDGSSIVTVSTVFIIIFSAEAARWCWNVGSSTFTSSDSDGIDDPVTRFWLNKSPLTIDLTDMGRAKVLDFLNFSIEVTDFKSLHWILFDCSDLSGLFDFII